MAKAKIKLAETIDAADVRSLQMRLAQVEITSRFLARYQIDLADRAEKLREAAFTLFVSVTAPTERRKRLLRVHENLIALEAAAKDVGPFRIHPKLREYAKTGRVTKGARK